MHENSVETLYLLSLVATTIEMTTCIICARQLWRQRKEIHDRSRRLLALGSFTSGLLAATALLGSIGASGPEVQSFLLHPWLGLVYMSMHIIMVLYPILVVRPGWLTPGRFFLLFFPTAFFALAFVAVSLFGQWTPLSSPGDIWHNVLSLDVILRLGSQLVMLPYCLILFALPYNYRKSSASFRWILAYSFGLTLICTVHVVIILGYGPGLVMVLPIIATVFYILSTEYELEERLLPGLTEDDSPENVLTPSAEEPLGELDLWSRICRIMDQDEAWRDPDLTLVSMAQLCATNITYLNRVIKVQTGGSFKDLVNAKRIACVAAQLRNVPDTDIQAAFFNAGYRSRTTAWRNFKDIMGVSPTNYLESQK